MLEMPFQFNRPIIKRGKTINFLKIDMCVWFSLRFLLSLSMEARGEYQQAADIGATALHLEGKSPIVSYHSIVRLLWRLDYLQ